MSLPVFISFPHIFKHVMSNLGLLLQACYMKQKREKTSVGGRFAKKSIARYNGKMPATAGKHLLQRPEGTL